VLGKAWGVVATDVDNDGWMDLFVANDTVANFLFVNQRNGKFQEMVIVAVIGTARSSEDDSSWPAWASNSADSTGWLSRGRPSLAWRLDQMRQITIS